MGGIILAASCSDRTPRLLKKRSGGLFMARSCYLCRPLINFSDIPSEIPEDVYLTLIMEHY